MLNIISLGAGVQSSTMALMAAHGEITPMPDCAIFADTGDEPDAVYTWLNWLEKQLPFPVHRVGKTERLSSASIKLVRTIDGERTYLKHSIPVFTMNQDGGRGMGRRQCTRDFKIDPIRRAVRDIGVTVSAPCSTWIGISTDEASRVKPSQDAAQIHRWPLIELGVSRDDCLGWFATRCLPTPPKSACTFCPYHSDEHWLSMSESEIGIAARYEQQLQTAYSEATALKSIPFLHRMRVPLIEAIEAVRNAPESPQMDMFDEACEGMCGV
jgi:hypothetical protein